MPGILLPSQWRQQPQQAVQVDWSNPLAANLQFLYAGIELRDVAGGRAGSFIGSAGSRVGPGGRSVAFDGSSRSIVFPRDARLEVPSGLTVWAYVCIPSYTPGTANDDFFCKTFNNNGSAPFLSWSLGNGSGSGGGASTAIKAAIGVGSSLFTVEMTCSVGLNLIGLTYDGANLRGWIGGANKATTAATGSVNYDTSSAGNLIIGGSSGASVNKDFRGDVYAAGFHSRVFSQSDFARLADNPWQLYKAPARRIWAAVSAGGPTIIDLSAASLGFSAKSPQARLASTLSAAQITTSAKAVQPRLETRLTAATMSTEAKPIQVGSMSIVELSTAAISFIGKSLQNALAATLTAASISMSAKSVQPRITAQLGSAAMSFTAQAITTVRNRLIQLTAAAMAFSAKAVTVTGEVATALARRVRGFRGKRRGQLW
jgi:hypothetical protein